MAKRFYTIRYKSPRDWGDIEVEATSDAEAIGIAIAEVTQMDPMPYSAHMYDDDRHVWANLLNYADRYGCVNCNGDGCEWCAEEEAIRARGGR